MVKKLAIGLLSSALLLGASLSAPAQEPGVDGDRPQRERRGEQSAEGRQRQRGAARPTDQGGERPEGRPGQARPGFGGDPASDAAGLRGMLQRLPIMIALDTDQDGSLSAAEIAKASESLKTLDKNDDGLLSPIELRPNFEAFAGRGPGGDPRGFERPNAEEIVARIMGFDKNNDGKVSADELPEQMRGMLRRADADGDGFVTKEEAIAMSARQPGPRGVGPQDDPAEALRSMLESADTNEDGKLSEAEVPEVFKRRFATIDRNQDGELDRAELAAALRMLRSGTAGNRPTPRD